jgi:hypothetical protein
LSEFWVLPAMTRRCTRRLGVPLSVAEASGVRALPPRGGHAGVRGDSVRWDRVE